MSRLLAFLAVLSCVTSIHAQGSASPPAPQSTDEKVDALTEAVGELRQTMATQVSQSGSEFFKHFGFGLGVSVDGGSRDRIDEAEVVDNVLRVKKDSNIEPRFLLELHFTFVCERPPLFRDAAKTELVTEEVLRKPSERKQAREYLALTEAARREKGTPDDLAFDDVNDPQKFEYIDIKPKKGDCLSDRRSQGIFVAVQPGSDNAVDALGLGWMWRLPDKIGSRALNLGLGYIVDQDVQVLGDGVTENAPLPTGETVPRFRTTEQGGFLFVVSVEVGG
jgi:hypothetical protein